MFQANEPIFRKHSILKAQMLEEGISKSTEILRLLYQDYADGILCGTQINVDSNYLIVKPGAILYEGHIYYMKKEAFVPYEANNKLMFLKISFLETYTEGDFIIRNTDIYLTSDEEERSNEMELCRFIAEKGAILRNNYGSFKDFGAEYNTINILSVPYAAKLNSSISPQITKMFGKEMLELNLTESLDVAFAIECMKGETIQKDMLTTYISKKMGLDEKNRHSNMKNELATQEFTNRDIYKYLLQIVDKVKIGEQNEETRRQMRKIII